MCALIYEVVWYQLLHIWDRIHFRLALKPARDFHGRPVHRRKVWFPRIRIQEHPLKIYAALSWELQRAQCLLRLSLPSLNRLYIAGAEHGMPGMLWRGVLAALCMLSATIRSQWIRTRGAEGDRP